MVKPVDLLAAGHRHLIEGQPDHALRISVRVRQPEGHTPRQTADHPPFDAQVPAQGLDIAQQVLSRISGQVGCGIDRGSASPRAPLIELDDAVPCRIEQAPPVHRASRTRAARAGSAPVARPGCHTSPSTRDDRRRRGAGPSRRAPPQGTGSSHAQTAKPSYPKALPHPRCTSCMAGLGGHRGCVDESRVGRGHSAASASTAQFGRGSGGGSATRIGAIRHRFFHAAATWLR